MLWFKKNGIITLGFQTKNRIITLAFQTYRVALFTQEIAETGGNQFIPIDGAQQINQVLVGRGARADSYSLPEEYYQKSDLKLLHIAYFFLVWPQYANRVPI